MAVETPVEAPAPARRQATPRAGVTAPRSPTITPVRRRIISTAFVRELLPSLGLAVGVTTFLLLIRSLFLLADLFIAKDVKLADALLLLLLAVPHVVVLTIPVGSLFAILLTTARWAADSELVALQSCGARPSQLLRPLVVFSAILVCLNAALTLAVVPLTNRTLESVTMRVAFSGARAAVEPRVFNEDFPGQLIYINRVDVTTERWRGILLFDLTGGDQERLVSADTGELVVDARTSNAWLQLENTTTHLQSISEPDKYQQNRNRELRILLTPTPSAANAPRRAGVRSTDTLELFARTGDPATRPEDRHEAWLELHRRLAIPAAVLVFAVVGFPLAARSRRGGRSFALLASVGMVVLYYVLLSNGELLARAHLLPVWLGIWLADIVLAATGIVLMRRLWRATRTTARRDPGAVRRFLARLRPGRQADTDETRDASAALPFLGVVDSYVLRQCLTFFLLVVVTVCALFTALSLSDKLGYAQRNDVSLGVLASYYAFTLPQILYDVLPLAFVIAFLATAALLDRHNEATALKSAGISLGRVAAPLLWLAATLGVLLFALGDSIVHRANRDAQRLDDIIRGRKVARSYRATDRLWLFLPDGRTLINFLQFDPDSATLVRPSLYVFDENLNLRSRFMASRAFYKDGRWQAEGAWSRRFLVDGSPDFTPRRTADVELPIAVKPSYFGREYRKPSQMSFGELRAYIATLRGSGYRVDRLLVQLHQKLAYPLSVVLLAWLALPFAFRLGRRGTVMGIALALGLGMGYFSVTAVITKLGEASLLPPVLAAWTPTVVFALLAINRHTTLRT